MSSAALDTLTLARRLEREADFPQAQAEATATILADTVDEAAVTRAHFDLKMMELDARFVQIDARFVEIDARFVEIKAKMSETETRLKYDMTLRLGAMIAASVAILAGLMKIMLHSLPLAP